MLRWIAVLALLQVTHGHIFPPPQSIQVTGVPLPLSKEFTITKPAIAFSTPRLDAAVLRFKSPHSPATTTNATLSTLDLVLNGNHSQQHPSLETDYSYQIIVKNNRATASAASEYGLMYALESFTQLIEETGTLPGNNIHINDAPAYKWRGLMIDTGRRFVPLSTVLNLLDTMAAVKLNVLHLHASDMCRFSSGFGCTVSGAD